MEQLKHTTPYSRLTERVRMLLPDLRFRLSLGGGLVLEASIKRHLGHFRPSILKREIGLANGILACAGPRAVLYDVGANIGLYTILFARDSARRIVSFEPAPSALAYLRRNVAINRLTNVDVHPILLSDGVGVRKFVVDSVTTASSHVAADGEAAEAVECSDLDSYVARMKLPLPDVVKIDVEGHDQQVILGMKKLLLQCHPTIFLEGGVRNGDGSIASASLLSGMGYELWNLGRTSRVDPRTLDYSFLAIWKAT